MAYKKKTVKLDTIFDGVSADALEIVPVSVPLTGAFVLVIPSGVSTFGLRFGQNKDSIILPPQGATFEVSGEDANQGLYAVNGVAIPGATVDVFYCTETPDQPGSVRSTGPRPRGTPDFNTA